MSDFKLPPLDWSRFRDGPSCALKEFVEAERLAAIEAYKAQAQPVAWMALCDGVSMMTARDKEELKASVPPDWQVVPLYAAPPAQIAQPVAWRQKRGPLSGGGWVYFDGPRPPEGDYHDNGQPVQDLCVCNAAPDRELGDLLREVHAYLYNPFEPDNQSRLYKKVDALVATLNGATR